MRRIRVAINGVGRIGRAFFKLSQERKDIELVAVNDLGDIRNIAYLLKYDSAYGRSELDIEVKEEKGNRYLIVEGQKVAFLSERDPLNLPWKKLKIDVVVESTGFFTEYKKARAHLDAGAKRVVVTAPVKDEPSSDKEATILMGINDNLLSGCEITSNASCTTNAGSPLIQILHEAVGVEKAMLNTVHGYTASQSIVDSSDSKNFRMGRAGAQNIVPTSTGAAIATTKVIKDLKDKFDGIAMRVPVVAGSIVDVTFIAKRKTTREEINKILKNAAKEKRWSKVFAVTEEPLVSSDILKTPYASIADLDLTRVVGGNLVKVLAWYDNEMGYTHALMEHVIESGRHIGT